MLKIVYGKSRSGKTTYIYNNIKEKYENNIKNNIKSYLIVPEQFSLSTEEKLIKYLNKGGLFNVEVLTLKRMAYYVFNELGLNIENITDVGKRVMIYNILSNGKFKMFNSVNKGNIDNILDIFAEFNRYGVTTQTLETLQFEDERLKDKVHDLSLIYSEYVKTIEENGNNYTNELEILNQYLNESRLMVDCDIYIDEFYGFTKQEYEIILKLAKKNNITISFCIDNIETSDNPLDIYNQNKIEYTTFINLCKNSEIKFEQIHVVNEKNICKQDAEIQHLQENIFAYPYTVYNGKSSKVNIYSCINAYTEIENLANMICNDIKNGYRYSDIIVITRDLEKYSDHIWAIFKKYNIPYFLDSKMDISDNQISILIFSLLDIVIENFSYQSMFSYLKTGFLDIDIDDIYQIENYVVKWGISGYKWNEDFRYDYDIDNQERKEQLELINNIRKQVVEPLVEFKKAINKCKCVEDIVKQIYKFLIDTGIQKRIEERMLYFKKNNLLQLEKEYTDIWNYYTEVFEQLILSVGSKEIDIIEFKKLLDIGFTNTQKSFVPIYKDCVLIGDIERTRTNEIKALYFIGTQNDKFPITYPTEGLLTDNDRQYLKNKDIQLAKTTNQNIMLDQFSIYKVISMCVDKVIFSYIFNDLNGTSFRPSFLINKIKKMFNIHEVLVDEEYIKNIDSYLPYASFSKVFENNIELLNWYKNNKEELYEKYIEICNFDNKMNINLDDDVISKIYTNELKTSISRIEEYVRCPYSFYLKYILKIKEKEIYTVRSLDIGNFNHQILDKFFKYIIDNNIDIKNLELDMCNDIAENLINHMLEDVSIQAIKYAKEFSVLKVKLKNTLQKAIWILVLQIKNSSFRPVGTEVEFGDNKEYHEISVEVENGKTVKLRGKIDRIDIADTKDGKYVRIIDYKSSNKSIDVSDIYNGLNIQLITYLDAVTQKEDGIIPGGIFYFKIDNPIIKTNSDISKEEIENKIIEQMRLDGLILNDKTLISHMDNRIESNSDLVNVKIDKEGNATTNNAVSLEEFKTLQNEAKKILKKISSQILSGKISVLPYWKNKNMYGCKYCSYNSVCKFNPKDSKCRYNIMRKV